LRKHGFELGVNEKDLIDTCIFGELRNDPASDIKSILMDNLSAACKADVFVNNLNLATYPFSSWTGDERAARDAKWP